MQAFNNYYKFIIYTLINLLKIQEKQNSLEGAFFAPTGAKNSLTSYQSCLKY